MFWCVYCFKIWLLEPARIFRFLNPVAPSILRLRSVRSGPVELKRHHLPRSLSGSDPTNFTFGFNDCVGNTCQNILAQNKLAPDGIIKLNVIRTPLLCLRPTAEALTILIFAKSYYCKSSLSCWCNLGFGCTAFSLQFTVATLRQLARTHNSGIREGYSLETLAVTPTRAEETLAVTPTRAEKL